METSIKNIHNKHFTTRSAWFPYGRNGRKNRVTIFLNGQFIIVYTCKPHINHDFLCVGVMYSGEYVCDVSLSVYPHRASLENMGIEPTTFGILVQHRENHD
jgi:hypothetical protein